jgi:hypothetical protein
MKKINRKIIIVLLVITILTSNYIETNLMNNLIPNLSDDEDAGWFANIDILEDEYQRL